MTLSVPANPCAVSPTVAAGQVSDQRDFTGERFLPGYADGSIELESIHRYVFALTYAAGRSILDIACGEGYGSDLLAQCGAQVLGVDVDAASIATARSRYRRPKLFFEVGNAQAIPASDHSFDLVVSFETIEHLDDQSAFWREIRRVLRPEGVLVLSSPNRDIYQQERRQANPFHLHELTQAELRDAVATRFAHYQLFHQSVVFGSQILPSTDMGTYAEVTLDAETRALHWNKGEAKATHPYSLIIASDCSVAALGQSLYRGHYPPGAMSALVGGIAERDQTICALRKQLNNAIAQMHQAERNLEERERALEDVTQQHEHCKLVARRLEETLAEHDRIISNMKCSLARLRGSPT